MGSKVHRLRDRFWGNQMLAWVVALISLTMVLSAVIEEWASR
jgi:hypothetical protein